jgi:ribosomal protein S18 acetylase RimI-like enzyme
MNLEYKEIVDLEQAYQIMKELRTKLSLKDFISIYNQARSADQYTLIGAFVGDECVAVMGYRILFDYVHGKHLYIDDLVTTESYRSKGVGAKLLKKAEEIAKKSACAYFRLCTGFENESAKKFYEREGLNLRAVVYKKKLK